MAGETLVAVYASRAEAERVRDRLRSVGVPDRDIRLSIDTDNDQRFAPVSGESGGAATTPKQEEGFFDWLFGVSVPESDQIWYRSTLREGRTAVSVRGGVGPKPGLGGETPLAVPATETRARLVETMLHQIDHGITP